MNKEPDWRALLQALIDDTEYIDVISGDFGVICTCISCGAEVKHWDIQDVIHAGNCAYIAAKEALDSEHSG